jgi:hypothetical protein
LLFIQIIIKSRDNRHLRSRIQGLYNYEIFIIILSRAANNIYFKGWIILRIFLKKATITFCLQLLYLCRKIFYQLNQLTQSIFFLLVPILTAFLWCR